MRGKQNGERGEAGARTVGTVPLERVKFRLVNWHLANLFASEGSEGEGTGYALPPA